MELNSKIINALILVVVITASSAALGCAKNIPLPNVSKPPSQSAPVPLQGDPLTPETANVNPCGRAAWSGEGQQNQVVAYRVLSPDEAKVKITNPQVMVLDVSTPQEFDKGHLENAVSLPEDQIQTQAEAIMPDKTTEILVVGQSGEKTREAARMLAEMGYVNVFDAGTVDHLS